MYCINITTIMSIGHITIVVKKNNLRVMFRLLIITMAWREWRILNKPMNTTKLKNTTYHPHKYNHNYNHNKNNQYNHQYQLKQSPTLTIIKNLHNLYIEYQLKSHKFPNHHHHHHLTLTLTPIHNHNLITMNNNK